MAGGCGLARALGLCLVLGQGPCWDRSGEKWSTGEVEGSPGSKGRPWAPHGDHPNSILLRETAGTLPGTVQCSEVVRVPPRPPGAGETPGSRVRMGRNAGDGPACQTSAG